MFESAAPHHAAREEPGLGRALCLEHRVNTRTMLLGGGAAVSQKAQPEGTTQPAAVVRAG
jgi:hypothetical protein